MRSSRSEPQKPPVFLNLLQIRLPITALISIAHRVTGTLLFLALPYFLYLWQTSVRDAAGFARVASLLDLWGMRLFTVLMVWALAHHFFAGLRYLLIDLGLGEEKNEARRGAWAVSVAGVVVALLSLVALL